MFMKKVLFFVLTLFIMSGCGEYVHPTIPRRAVDFYIHLDDSRYQNLLNYGGYVYLTGGVNGLIVYRLTEDMFMCYDRACPYDWQDENAWIWVADDGLTLYCTKCGSRFNILDGSVVNGPAEYQLCKYNAYFDGFRVRIYN